MYWRTLEALPVASCPCHLRKFSDSVLHLWAIAARYTPGPPTHCTTWLVWWTGLSWPPHQSNPGWVLLVPKLSSPHRLTTETQSPPLLGQGKETKCLESLKRVVLLTSLSSESWCRERREILWTQIQPWINWKMLWVCYVTLIAH